MQGHKQPLKKVPATMDQTVHSTQTAWAHADFVWQRPSMPLYSAISAWIQVGKQHA